MVRYIMVTCTDFCLQLCPDGDHDVVTLQVSLFCLKRLTQRSAQIKLEKVPNICRSCRFHFGSQGTFRIDLTVENSVSKIIIFNSEATAWHLPKGVQLQTEDSTTVYRSILIKVWQDTSPDYTRQQGGPSERDWLPLGWIGPRGRSGMERQPCSPFGTRAWPRLARDRRRWSKSRALSSP